MRIDLLYIDACPNWEQTLRLLRMDFDSTGHAKIVPIGVELIDSEESADRYLGTRGFPDDPHRRDRSVPVRRSDAVPGLPAPRHS